MKLTAAQARRLAIRSQGLDGAWGLPAGKEGAAQAVERLGFVQLDTIAVVARAHHHQFWSRCPDYTPDVLHELLAHDRRVYEYWTKAASYVPMCDYRYSLPRMRAVASNKKAWYYTAEGRRVTKHVLARIRKEGPLGSADFKAPPGRKRGPWWDWKPAKQALEFLFDSGQLMVAERRHFHRIYDLTERVLPPGVDTTPPAPEEMARFIARRVLGRDGFARAQGIRWAWQRPAILDDALAELMDAGEVTPITIQGTDGEHYALASALDGITARGGARRLHILSPFDGMVMNRWRTRQIFGFPCKLECYLPAAKRRWGYFCLPILWGDRFVGRLDPKADRKARTLRVLHLMFEPEFKSHDRILKPLAEKLWDFAAFNGCDTVQVEKATPAKVKAPLNRVLQRGK